MYKSHISVYVDAHSLPALCDSLRYYDSQMILCSTFFTCNNLLFHKDEAKLHFRILATFQQNYLRHEDEGKKTFHSFNIPFIKYLIKVH